MIAAIPDVDWDDVKDAPLLHLLLESRGSLDMMSDAWNEDNDEPSQALPIRPVRGPIASGKQKGTAQVKSAPTAITPTIDAFVSPFFDGAFTVVGKRPSFLNEEKLARGQPPIQSMSADKARYQV